MRKFLVIDTHTGRAESVIADAPAPDLGFVGRSEALRVADASFPGWLVDGRLYVIVPMADDWRPTSYCGHVLFTWKAPQVPQGLAVRFVPEGTR
jgi:hypothetical protein